MIYVGTQQILVFNIIFLMKSLFAYEVENLLNKIGLFDQPYTLLNGEC